MGELRQIWEQKVARLRETHGLGDNDARLKARDIFPELMLAMLGEGMRARYRPGRIAHDMELTGCSYEEAAYIVDNNIQFDVTKLHPDDREASAMVYDPPWL